MQDVASDLSNPAALDTALESQGLPKAVPGSLGVAVPLGGTVSQTLPPSTSPPPPPDSGGADGIPGGGMGLAAGAGGGGAAVLLVGAALMYMRRRRAAGAKHTEHSFDGLSIPPVVRPPELREPRTLAAEAMELPVRDTEGKEMVRTYYQLSILPTSPLSLSLVARCCAMPRARRVANTCPGLSGRWLTLCQILPKARGAHPCETACMPARAPTGIRQAFSWPR